MLGAFHWAARSRRRWYVSHPELRRRLRRPVVSVGNLGFGGSGKTPMVRYLAATLLQLGERPAILSRGYGRLRPEEGVVIVRDPERMRADLARAGDEPLMLARGLSGAAVLVSPDRYLSGRLAEEHLGCTVHLLDDGFQHLRLARDVDCVMVTRDDFESGPRRPPREALDAIQEADAVFLAPDLVDLPEGLPALSTRRVFRTVMQTDRPRRLGNGDTIPISRGLRVVAAAGIARPYRFFQELERAGFIVTRSYEFSDHHQFSLRDLNRLSDAVRHSHAELVMTTEKDMVRLLPLRPMKVPVAWLPITYSVTATEEFRGWLSARIHQARAQADN